MSPFFAHFTVRYAQPLAASLILVLLAGCSSNRTDGENLGTILGGVGGAALGSLVGKGNGKLVAVAAGAIGGAMLGSYFGEKLDPRSKQLVVATTQDSLESAKTGASTSWSNPDNGNRGTITPTNTFQNPNGQYCREYNQTIMIGGKSESGYGTACRQPDGSWKVIS